MLETEQEIIEVYRRLLDEREGIAGMILERQGDLDEHVLVLKTLRGCDQDKKAWRLVGDVLVERDVRSVIPEIEKNRDSLKGVVENAKQQLEAKAKEMREFEKKYNIKIKEKGEAQGSEKKEGSKGQQGVLVK
jgi:prefoldin subunit 2